MIIEFENLPAGIDVLEREWEGLHPCSAGLKLYHFTSPKGLDGILRSGSIWAKLASDLDDELELKHARPGRPTDDHHPYTTTWQQPWEALLFDNYRHDPIGESVEAWERISGPFVTSFCRCSPWDVDSCAHMWEEYAKHGSGVALGIVISDPGGSTTSPTSILRRVLYDKSVVDEICKRFGDLNRHVETFRKRLTEARLRDQPHLPLGYLDPGMVARREGENAKMDALQDRLHRLGRELAACTKSDKFSSEQEIRLLAYQVEHPLTDKSEQGKVFTYIEVPMCNLHSRSARATNLQVRLDLVEIVVGPAADIQELDRILSPSGVPSIDVAKVQIHHCRRRA